MRILVVTPTFLPIIGGIETGIYEIYRRLGATHEVRILTIDYGKSLAHLEVDDVYYKNMNFEIYRFKDPLHVLRFQLPNVVKELLPPFSISCVPAVFKQIRSFRPNVINFHTATFGGLSLILVRLLKRIPVALSLVGRADVYGRGNSAFKVFTNGYLWMAIKSASSVISNSKYYLHLFPGASEFERIIPYGVDVGRFSSFGKGEEIRKKLQIDRDVKVLFALQRLSRTKRVDILIKSLKYILSVDKKVILIIGGKGSEEKTLKAIAKESNVHNNVIFTGYIPEEDIPKYFALADIFLFSSPDETFGVVLAQAMAAGKPIVAVNATSTPFIVDHGKNGTLVDSLDPKNFAKAVIDLLCKKEALAGYSENGQRKAVKEYEWDVIAQNYENVFKELSKR